MFEKEAEEYSVGTGHAHYNFLFEENAGAPKDFAKLCFKDGAEFGYNKAIEWHYVEKELPTDIKFFYIVNIYSFSNFGEMYHLPKVCKWNGENFVDLEDSAHIIKTDNCYSWQKINYPDEEKAI